MLQAKQLHGRSQHRMPWQWPLRPIHLWTGELKQLVAMHFEDDGCGCGLLLRVTHVLVRWQQSSSIATTGSTPSNIDSHVQSMIVLAHIVLWAQADWTCRQRPVLR